MTDPRSRHPARTVAACASVCVVAGLVAAGSAAATAAPATATMRAGAAGTVTLAPGVTLRHVSTYSDGAPEQVTLLGVDLTVPGVGIDAASPRGLVGAQRATVRAQTVARHAIAGVNADFFDLDRDTAAPRGVLVSSGQLLKSSTDVRNANLVVRRSATGALSASVGALPFTGRVTRVRKGGADLRRTLTSVDSLADARAGGITLLTPRMAPSAVGAACTLASGMITRSTWTVRAVRTGVRSTPALAATDWGLLSCASGGNTWLRTSLRAGDRLQVTDSLGGATTPWAAIGGGSVLVRGGRAWDDPDGEVLAYPGRNAETFACIARSGRYLTLGTVDGYSWRSAGMTYRQLSDYLLSLGCWSGVVLDGGGSSTMVARLPGAAGATVQNVPADDPPRQVADSLVVFGK